MDDYPVFSSDKKDPGFLNSIRPAPDFPNFEKSSSILRNRKFRAAWMGSLFLHTVLFISALWTPSSAKYRFYGSGTAVSLVGADEIPGGSAKGKSGDRSEDLVKPKSFPGKKARKIDVKEVKEKKKETKPQKKETKKKVVKKEPPKEKPAKRVEPKKPERKISVKKDKKPEKKVDKKRLAELERIKKRRERQRKWREKWEKTEKAPLVTAKEETAPLDDALEKRKRDEGRGQETLTKKTESPLRKPPVGYPGQGGGDGQGGGSLGGGSGGVGRTDIERYYGLLAERIRNYWTVPPNLTDVGKLKTEIVVDVGRDGAVRNLRVQKNSGNRVYDSAALRAVQRAADPSFPPPPNSVKENWLYLGFRFCGHNFCRN